MFTYSNFSVSLGALIIGLNYLIICHNFCRLVAFFVLNSLNNIYYVFIITFVYIRLTVYLPLYIMYNYLLLHFFSPAKSAYPNPSTSFEVATNGHHFWFTDQSTWTSQDSRPTWHDDSLLAATRVPRVFHVRFSSGNKSKEGYERHWVKSRMDWWRFIGSWWLE